MDKLGSVVDPLDGVAAGSTQQHGVGSGVFLISPSGGRAGGGLFLDTLDAPVMAPAVGAEQAYTSLPLSPAPLVGPVTGWTSVLFTNASTHERGHDRVARMRRNRSNQSRRDLTGPSPQAWAMNFPLWSTSSSFRFRFRVRLVGPPPPSPAPGA
jgi:hypothetical protein